MSTSPTRISPPRFESREARLVAGIRVRYAHDQTAGIPVQWGRLHDLGDIPGRIGDAAYGVCSAFDAEASLDYLCGFEVDPATSLPAGVDRIAVPAQRYAVFHQPGHIATIRIAFSAIWNFWLPGSGHKVAAAPVLERYGPEFDPRTGTGGFEIWLPIEG